MQSSCWSRTSILLAFLLGGLLQSFVIVQAKNSDKYFLTKCGCHNGPRGKPDCDFSKLTKARLRKLVDRLMGSQIVCVEAEGYVIPTFTSALSPLSAVTGLSNTGEIQLSGYIDKDGKVVKTDPITVSTTGGGSSAAATGSSSVTDKKKESKGQSGKNKASTTSNSGAKGKKPVVVDDEEDDDEDGDEKDNNDDADADNEDDDDDEKDSKSKQKKKTSAPTASKKQQASNTGTSSKDKKSTTSNAGGNNGGMVSANDKLNLSRRQFINTIPSSCTLDGFHCSTESGLELLFPTAIVLQELVTDAYSYQMNEELKQLMLDLEEEDEGCKFNLHGGYRSSDGFLSRPDRSVQWLKKQIIPRIDNLLRMANASAMIPSNHYTVDGWGAVLRGGHGQNMHVHPGSMYAGVYYVTAPPEIAQAEKGKSGGCLSFYDPRTGVNMAQVVRGKNIYGEAIEICPGHKGGLLVIFPSWLMHEVKPVPESYKGPRIGISFNAVYKPQ